MNGLGSWKLLKAWSMNILEIELMERELLTEFTSFEAIACEDLRGTRASSAPAITNTGMSSTAFNNDIAFC